MWIKVEASRVQNKAEKGGNEECIENGQILSTASFKNTSKGMDHGYFRDAWCLQQFIERCDKGGPPPQCRVERSLNQNKKVGAFWFL